MKFFVSMFARNAINPIKHDLHVVPNKNYYKALSELAEAAHSSAKTAESAAKTLNSTTKVAVQFIATSISFDYVAGKIVTAQALSGLVPLTALSNFFNYSYELFTNYPTTAFVFNTAANFATYTGGLTDLIKNPTNFLSDTVSNFEYVAGKAVTAQALSGLVPSATLTQGLDYTYKILTTNPTAAFGATLAASVVAYPEGVVGLIKNTGNIGYYGAKTLYHSLNSGSLLTKHILDQIIGENSSTVIEEGQVREEDNLSNDFSCSIDFDTTLVGETPMAA
jgi:hypothetical protein